MNNLKIFVKTKRGKSILFFGFYLVFFIVLFIMFQNRNVSNNDIKKDNTSNLISINKLISLDNYQYDYVIDIDGEIQRYYGMKENKNYNNFEDNYFLDIYNINQMIKKSKIIVTKDNKTTYEIDNETLNVLLNTEVSKGVNKIDVTVGNNYLKIILDLHEYKEKDIYNISLEYRGVNNE